MRIEQILESVLNTLAEQSVKAENHEERKKKDKTAYALIRELYGYEDKKKLKHWDDYYFSMKRGLM